MEPTFVEKGPIRLVGIFITGELSEIMAQMSDIWLKRFPPYEDGLKPFSIDKAYYGAWTWKIPGELQGYMAGFAVDGLDEVPAGLEEIVLPAARYAVFDATVGSFGQVYDQIYSQWLPASPYEYDDMAADFEYYPPGAETADSPTRIYIPVRRRG